MIPEQTIARIRESVDLVELVRESVQGLKRAGRNFRARCPFHQERTPSFNVNPEMGVFKCFGCGAGGDAFKFLMMTESLSYPEAIRKLAGRVGIVIEEQQLDPQASAEAKAREALYALNEDAARFYHRTLMEAPEAEEARAYLQKRGLDRQSLEKFSIGFAPASGFALREAALKKGIDLLQLERAGLVRRKEGSGRFLDNFWNRILFPIRDTQGRLVAFGGRAMGDAMPKYINSPDTPIYEKSRHLYGLFEGLATLRKARRMIVLEGYMDVVVCHQFGIENAGATLGTALTDAHVKLLRRYADRVTLLFDPDNAGAAATVRGGELLVAAGFQVDVVTLPDGKDPDEILVERGREALDTFLEQPVSYIDYRLQTSARKFPGRTPEARLAVAREVLPVVQLMPDPLLQDDYLSRIANALQVEKSVLAKQMKTGKRMASDQPGTKISSAIQEPEAAEAGLSRLESELLLAALLFPSETVARALDALEWSENRCHVAWQAIRSDISQGQKPGPNAVASLEGDIQNWVTGLATQERQYDKPEDVIVSLLSAIERQKQTQTWQQLKVEIDEMIEGRKPSDPDKIRRYNDLSKQLKGTKTLFAQEAPSHG